MKSTVTDDERTDEKMGMRRKSTGKAFSGTGGSDFITDVVVDELGVRVFSGRRKKIASANTGREHCGEKFLRRGL